VGEAYHVETNEGVPPPLLSLPRIFIARVSTKGNDFPGGSITILILILLLLLIIIIIDHVTLLTCRECRFTYFI